MKSNEYVDTYFGNPRKKIHSQIINRGSSFYVRDCSEQLGDHSFKEIYTWTQTPSFKEAKILRFIKERIYPKPKICIITIRSKMS